MILLALSLAALRASTCRESRCHGLTTCVGNRCQTFLRGEPCEVDTSDVELYFDFYYLKEIEVNTTCWNDYVTYWIRELGDSPGMSTAEYEAQNQNTLRRVEKNGDDWAAMGRVVPFVSSPTESSCLLANNICDKIQIGERLGSGIVKQVFSGNLAGDDIVIKTISETQIDRIGNQPYLPFYKLFKECELFKLLMKEHPKHSLKVYGICLNIQHNDNDRFSVNPGLILERGSRVDFNHREIKPRIDEMLDRMSNTMIGTIEITDIKRVQFVQKNNDIHCIDLGDVRFHRNIDKQAYTKKVYDTLNIRQVHETNHNRVIDTLVYGKKGRVVRTMKQTTCDIQRFTSRAANLWWIGNEQGKQWNPEWLDKSKKFAYVWWTSQSDYTWSALVAIKSLKSTNPSEQIDFVLIHTIALSDRQKQWLDAFGVKCISFENAVSVQNSQYANNKLYIFKLTQYDKLLFMDSDSMPLQNLDHMFMFPDAPVVAPCSYWEPKQQPKLTAWILLVQPNHESYDLLMERAVEMPKQTEMDTINDVLKKDMILLPSYYGLLNSEWENDGNGAFHNHDKDIYNKVPIVHYTIKGKPWQHPKDFFRGDLWDEEANALHTRWWKFRDSLKISHGAPRCEQIRARAVEMVEDDGFVPTGDIDDMWIRDSAAQVHPLLDSHPELVRKVIEKQAFYIEFDPYANSYGRTFREPSILGRHGWVTTRNYELDSGAYFIRLVHAYWKRTGEKLGAAAVDKLLSVWRVEQHHAHSLYRYDELQDGVGTPVGYTGMTWTGFRPSDDKCTYHYHIPDNVFAAVALGYLKEMGYEVDTLRDDIIRGIHTFGVQDGIYCYEVDGLGNCNKMDDANLPSLLSLPYLDPDQTVYDRDIWERTRAFVLSDANPYYYSGKYSGVGSPHTPYNHVWHLSLIVQAMQGDSEALKTLEETASEPGHKASAFHESFHVDNPNKYTRKWFAWADALYLELCN